MRPHILLGLCLFCLLGCATSSDIPFVFGENSSDLEGYHPDQLVNISTASPDLAGVPPISTLDDGSVLIFPVDSSNASKKNYVTVRELKEEFGYKFWQKKGQVLFSQGRYEEALSAFYQSIQENPKNAESWCSMGFVLLHLSRYDEAIKCFDVAIALEPALSDARNSKAEALYSLGRCDEALKACNETIRSNPMSPNAWLTRALILKKQSREAFIIARAMM